jgi:hypothetical protein
LIKTKQMIEAMIEELGAERITATAVLVLWGIHREPVSADQIMQSNTTRNPEELVELKRIAGRRSNDTGEVTTGDACLASPVGPIGHCVAAWLTKDKASGKDND